MKNSVSCGRKKSCEKTERIEKCSRSRDQNSAKERTLSAVLLFGAVICMAWLCHFPSDTYEAKASSGGASLAEYEVVEVFNEIDMPLSEDMQTVLKDNAENKDKPEAEKWTLKGYFKEFISALLGI